MQSLSFSSSPVCDLQQGLVFLDDKRICMTQALVYFLSDAVAPPTFQDIRRAWAT
jgi:hypothetical protein